MADVATTTDSTLTNATPTIASHPMHGMHGHHLPPVDLFALLKDYRTGNLFLDTLLCLLVPLAIQQLLAFLQGDGDIGSIRIVSIIYNWFFGKEEEEVIERTIEITQRFNRDGHKVWDWEQKNHLLQKAISLYLADVLDLENKNAKYELLEKRTKKVSDSASNDGASDTSDSSYYSDDEEDDDGGYCDVDYLCVDTLPLENTWITVEKGIQFMHEVVSPENPGDRKGVTETKVVFRFQSKLKDGSDRIEAFIDKAYTRYQEMEREKVYEDKSRYFYIQAGTSSSSTSAENTQQAVAFKRYALGEEKKFENLFFDEKEQVMQLLDNFANKTGKFAIKGFPYKLGFLLHGPPGTGKTSLIKAIAHYTKRHIVTINLGKMKSNQQLMDAMFDLKFTVPGLDSPVEYGFKDVIFVMEDIDCASSIVNKRDGDDDEETENKPEDSEKNEAGEKTEREPESEEMTSKKNKKKDTKEMSDDEKLMSMMIKLVMEDDKKHAKINLAGLLNVLDGVIDCPGRIIIMTSNHPEKLDLALIRPGRVNKKLLLSYMNATQVQKMIEYYSMTELNDAHVERLNSIFDRAGKRVSPAEVEEMCAEYDSMEAVLDGLERIACCTPVL